MVGNTRSCPFTVFQMSGIGMNVKEHTHRNQGYQSLGLLSMRKTHYRVAEFHPKRGSRSVREPYLRVLPEVCLWVIVLTYCRLKEKEIYPNHVQLSSRWLAMLLRWLMVRGFF
ncbi:hypothetical protein LXL04_037931 [Taraxacum kok-saghyz]